MMRKLLLPVYLCKDLVAKHNCFQHGIVSSIGAATPATGACRYYFDAAVVAARIEFGPALFAESAANDHGLFTAVGVGTREVVGSCG